mgnify:FL=1
MFTAGAVNAYCVGACHGAPRGPSAARRCGTRSAAATGGCAEACPHIAGNWMATTCKESRMHASWTTLAAALPVDGTSVEFLLDERECPMRGIYAAGRFPSRWMDHAPARVGRWRIADSAAPGLRESCVGRHRTMIPVARAPSPAGHAWPHERSSVSDGAGTGTGRRDATRLAPPRSVRRPDPPNVRLRAAATRPG